MSRETNVCSMVAMSCGRESFFARNQELGIISVLHHVRVRGEERQIVGEDDEEKRA